MRAHAHRHAHRGRLRRRTGARPGGGRRRVPDQALFPARAAGPRRSLVPEVPAWPADVALSQALSYARDLKSRYEIRAGARERAGRGQRTSAQRVSAVAAVRGRPEADATGGSSERSSRACSAWPTRSRPRTRTRAGTPSASRRLARRAGARGWASPQSAAETIAQAGLLHDLGKIGVPEGILRKPGPLTADEWEIMRRHPVTGAQIVAPLEFFDEGAIIVRHHHERLRRQRLSGRAARRDDSAGRAHRGGRRRVRCAHVESAVPRRGSRTPRRSISFSARAAARSTPHLIALFVEVLETPPTHEASDRTPIDGAADCPL